MPTSDTWRKSSYSGGGDGNNCVEIATTPVYVSIRDSKHPTHGPLFLRSAAFTTFLIALK